MKKLLTVLLGVLMVLSLAGCGSKDAPVEDLTEKCPTAANTYADYVAAANDTELELLMSVQGHESWWDGKVTVYAQDDDGGYLCYDGRELLLQTSEGRILCRLRILQIP